MTRRSIKRMQASDEVKTALLKVHATRSVKAKKEQIHAVAMELAAQTGWVRSGVKRPPQSNGASA